MLTSAEEVRLLACTIAIKAAIQENDTIEHISNESLLWLATRLRQVNEILQLVLSHNLNCNNDECGGYRT